MDVAYVWNLKYNTSEPICKTEIDSQTQNSPLVAKREVDGEGKDWESGISGYKLLCLGWIDSKVLL